MIPTPDTTGTLSNLLDATISAVTDLATQWDWAEDEIVRARRRHPTAADTLHHSFALLRPTATQMATEFVYRSHCRELLDRVAAGTDTRPATAAEICCACCDSSQIGPLTATAAGLYGRMWATAFPDQPQFGDRHSHHEALRGSAITDIETTLRTTLAVPDRRLGSIRCTGRHHGQAVACRYAAVDGDA